MGAYPASDAPLRNPITGIVCCARAASGHAVTAPPRTPRKSRRFMSGPVLQLQHGNGSNGRFEKGAAVARD